MKPQGISSTRGQLGKAVRETAALAARLVNLLGCGVHDILNRNAIVRVSCAAAAKASVGTEPASGRPARRDAEARVDQADCRHKIAALLVNMHPADIKSTRAIARDRPIGRFSVAPVDHRTRGAHTRHRRKCRNGARHRAAGRHDNSPGRDRHSGPHHDRLLRHRRCHAVNIADRRTHRIIARRGVFMRTINGKATRRLGHQVARRRCAITPVNRGAGVFRKTAQVRVRIGGHLLAHQHTRNCRERRRLC